MKVIEKDLTMRAAKSSNWKWRRRRETAPFEFNPDEIPTQWANIERELFAALYAPHRNRDLDEGAQDAVGSKIMGQLRTAPKWGEMAKVATYHADVAFDVAEALMERFREENAEALEKMAQAGNPDHHEQEAQEKREEAVNAPTQAAADALEQQAAEADQKAADARQAIDEAGQAMAESMARAGGQMAQDALDKGKERQRAMEGTKAALGGDLTGENAPIAKEMVDFLMRNPGLAGMLDLLGSANFPVKKKAGGDGYCDVVGVEQGDDPQRLISTEVAKLCHPATETDLMRRLVQKEALTWEIEGEEDGRGAFVCVLDMSGSMNRNNPQANALALASLLSAEAEGRETKLITVHGRTEVIDTQDKMAVLRKLGSRCSGGTPMMGALREAVRISDDLEDSDILVITDDELDGDPTDLLEPFKEQGGEVYALTIGRRRGSVSWATKAWDVQPGAVDASSGEVLQEVLG